MPQFIWWALSEVRGVQFHSRPPNKLPLTLKKKKSPAAENKLLCTNIRILVTQYMNGYKMAARELNPPY